MSLSRIDTAHLRSESGCDSISAPAGRLDCRRFYQRIFLLALLFFAEYNIRVLWLAGYPRVQLAGWLGAVHGWNSWVYRCAVVFVATFVTFAYLKNKTAFERISAQVEEIPIRWGLFACHCFAMGVFAGLSALLYRGGGPSSWANLLEASWFIVGVSAIALAGVAFLPWGFWAQLIRSTGNLWAYASIAAGSAYAVGNSLQGLWEPASYLTLRLSKIFLIPFVSSIIANPVTRVIGTQRFRVRIGPACSGLEGVGLMLAFVILWLLLFRKECRFPRSLVLIPLGLTLSFLLNAVRIAALILIGNAGAPQVAIGGFHSQAGWIAFSAVGVGFCFLIQGVPWLTTRQHIWESLGTGTHNPTAAFLSPFLSIIAAGMIAGAARGTAGLEWLYPLRFFAALGMLLFFRRSYASLNWMCDWMAPAIGVLVFVVWIGLDRFSNPAADQEVSAALMGCSTLARMTWITFRVLAAVLTIPLAEELAFRGFLMRRLISRDFESISLRRFSWFALLASSAASGFAHGGSWIAGSIAGILFGLAAIRRERIGDAVIAHATANALLAGYVLTYHRWHLW